MLSKSAKICLGVSLGVVALATIAVAEGLIGDDLSEEHIKTICLVFGAAGAASLLLGCIRPGQQVRESPAGKAAATADRETRPLAFFKSLKYWGAVFILLAGAVYFVVEYRRPKPEVLAVEPTPPPKPAEPTNAPVIFPPMKLAGIVFKKQESLAVINGRIYAVGDYVGEARVAAIDRESVTLELGGQTQVLSMWSKSPLTVSNISESSLSSTAP